MPKDKGRLRKREPNASTDQGRHIGCPEHAKMFSVLREAGERVLAETRAGCPCVLKRTLHTSLAPGVLQHLMPEHDEGCRLGVRVGMEGARTPTPPEPGGRQRQRTRTLTGPLRC